uniref:NADH-ubiquinone oxidoreductase chain 6 n=1 Tax=Trigonopterus kotamobagensis TaxID=2583401 RepID=A0A7H1KI28_9CUCU|nr:NADH dehydrogenase subunit 6 [Trigonopterus kotamobagensis]QNT26944.1 NADH dehydrogenase subunit 6 [Trigonopterus kotamobagensis]
MLLKILLLNWLFSLLFMSLTHPLSLGSILLIQTTLIAWASGFLYPSFWFSYILFLVMIGGMLVMFIYMTSVASNEKFSLPKRTLYFFCLSLSIFSLLSLFLNNQSFLPLNPSILPIQLLTPMNNMNMTKYFNFPSMSVLIFLMMYLLVTLIAIVKITDKTKSTLRQK